MSVNPYQAPQHPAEPAPVAADAGRIRSLVRPPAVCLIVLAAAAMLLDAAIIAHAVVNDAPLMIADYGRAAGLLMATANVSINTLIFLIHGFVLHASVRMSKLQGWSEARTAAVVSLLPFCSPLIVLGIPFGIWALMVLLREDVREGFRAAEPPRHEGHVPQVK